MGLLQKMGVEKDLLSRNKRSGVKLGSLGKVGDRKGPLSRKRDFKPNLALWEKGCQKGTIG